MDLGNRFSRKDQVEIEEPGSGVKGLGLGVKEPGLGVKEPGLGVK